MSSNEAQTSASGLSTQRVSAFECIICMDVLINPRVLPCGHSYCSSPKTCLSNLLKLKTPPQCVSCNHELPVNTSEDDVPRNYALSSAIEETQASSEEGSKCPKHQKDLAIYCRQCSALICHVCWRIEHKDKNKHEVEPFSCTLERYSEMQSKVDEFRQETEKLSKMLNRQATKCSELLHEIHNTEVVLKKLLCSSNPVTMKIEADVLRTYISDTHFKLSDVEAFPMEFLQEQLKHIRSKLMTTTEWEVIPEVPKAEKIPVSLTDTPRLAEMDIAQKNLYLHLSGRPEDKVRRYELERGIFIFRKEMITSVQSMCVVNDRIVVLPGKNIEEGLQILDKYTLEKIENKRVALLEKSYSAVKIAGYIDVLVVMASYLSMDRLAVFRGEHLNEETSLEIKRKFENPKFCNGLSLCNNRTFMVHNGARIFIFDFNGKTITRERCITINDCQYIRDVAFKSLPMSSPSKGYLLVKSFGFGGVMFFGPKSVSALKVDIESVEDGAALSTVIVPEMSGSDGIVLHLPPAVLVHSNETKKYWMLFIR